MTDDRGDLIRALDLDKAGDWDKAHGIVQRMESNDAHWIHAYLHREEGDLGNSRYWYNRAGKIMPEYGLDQEWDVLYTMMTQKQ